MIALIDVETFVAELKYWEDGQSNYELVEEVFRDLVQKHSLFIFESGHAPESLHEQQLISLRGQLQDAVARVLEIAKEKQEAEAKYENLRRSMVEGASKLAKSRHPQYKCSQCHARLKMKYHPGVLVGPTEPVDLVPQDAGTCPSCGGIVEPVST